MLILILILSSEKPQIIDIYTSSDTTKEVGDRVELNCRASGIPEPIITWRMAGGGILPTGGRELTVNSSLGYIYFSMCFVYVIVVSISRFKLDIEKRIGSKCEISYIYQGTA